MKETAIHVARLMAAAARTAPKGGGKDFLEIAVIDKDAELQAIAARMKAYAPQSSNENYWLRDSANIDQCQALVLIGLRAVNAAGYDCGACGYASCKEFLSKRSPIDKPMGYGGPHCAMRLMDIGCALSSAAKTASLLNLDNRVQQRVGAAAKDLGFIQADAVMGIPVGFFSKSPFHDRPSPKK